MNISLPMIPPPKRGSEEELQDLVETMSQFQKRIVPENMQRRCDDDMTGLFHEMLENRGIDIKYDVVDNLLNSTDPIIFVLKEYYDRPRPQETAKNLGIPFKCDMLESAQTPAYPSGHTIQAHYTAYVLSEIFPELEKLLHTLAEAISQSRIDRGVHFPSDVEYGKMIAQSLYKNL
tara:strand:- start:2 stop:529 length:528 start_codon:yes stop_codon:yes gene_type:complete